MRIWVHRPSWWAQHDLRILRELVTLHLKSGSVMNALSSPAFPEFFYLVHRMGLSTFRVDFLIKWKHHALYCYGKKCARRERFQSLRWYKWSYSAIKLDTSTFTIWGWKLGSYQLGESPVLSLYCPFKRSWIWCHQRAVTTTRRNGYMCSGSHETGRNCLKNQVLPSGLPAGRYCTPPQ